MAGPTHDELHRDIGGLERGQEEMERRLGRIEKMIEDGFKALRSDIDALKMREVERSAFERAGIWLSGIVGAAAALIIQHFWK
jgi:hypothetical protein